MEKIDLIDIEGIVRDWLETHDGYDGLCNAGLECGCPVDDLMPCFEPEIKGCVAGHKAEAFQKFDFMIYEGKRTQKKS